MFNSETQTNNFETSQMKIAALLRDQPDCYEPLVIPNNVTRPTINVHHKVITKTVKNSQLPSALNFFLSEQKNITKIQFLTLLLKVASSRETVIISLKKETFHNNTIMRFLLYGNA